MNKPMYFVRFHYPNGTHTDTELFATKREALKAMRESIEAVPLQTGERGVVVTLKRKLVDKRKRAAAHALVRAALAFVADPTSNALHDALFDAAHAYSQNEAQS